MTGYIGKTTNGDSDVVGMQTQSEREAQWGEMPGKIVSFDGATQTATIQPLYKPKHNGVAVDMPELLEVPVRFPRAGNGAFTMPIQAGDVVTLRPQMRSSENYHGGEDYEASDTRSFNLSDMEAYLDGGESLANPIPNFDGSNMHMRFDPEGQFGVKGSKDGKIKIEGSEGNIYDLLAQVVELLASDTLEIKYGSSAGTGHALEHQSAYAAIAAKLRAMAL